MRYLLFLFVLSRQVTLLAAPSPPFSIRYDHAGLTQIVIEKGTLTYVTHTLRKDLMVAQQDLSSYDRHEVVVVLSEPEKQSLLKWLRTHDWERLAKGYACTDRESYGAAFVSALVLELDGDQRHRASWDGTSKCPEIGKAVAELESICTEIAAGKDALP